MFKPKRKVKSSPTRRRTVRRLLIQAALLVCAVGLVWLAWLDYKVVSQFEGKKWALPAHVFARPLELYEGLQLDRDELIWELQELGYRRQASAGGPGQFSVAPGRVELFTRPFEFWDGHQAARRLMISFVGNRVFAVEPRDKKPFDGVVRLDPVKIGGIYPTHWEDREMVRLGDIPHYMPDALVAVEDRSFYQHHGISLRGISRAMVNNLKAGRWVEGGSTITQQLVKNYFLTLDRDWLRKLQEIPMALLLELHYDKQQILEAYINEINLGQAGKRAIHGYGIASRHYFRQPLDELGLHQVALLVGIGKGASYYNPWRHPERAKERRNLILDVLVREGVATQAEADAAKKKSLDIVAKPSDSLNDYPAYFDMVKRQLQQDYRGDDLQSDGLRVYTNLDPILQHKLDTSIDNQLGRIETGYKLKPQSLQSAAVVVSVGSGEILAISGGRDAASSGFNRALDIRRSIGSTVKPAVYLAALEQGYSLADLVSDAPVSIGTDQGAWQPKNFDHQDHGMVPLYQALGNSYNQATASLGMQVGLGQISAVIKRLGYKEDLKLVPSLTLGAVGMSPIQVAEMYHTIAAEGFYSPLRVIREVYTADNKPLARYPFEVEQRFSAENIHQLQYAMQVVMRQGTGRSAYRTLDPDLLVAGKTGTSDDQRDSWFSGFSGNLLTVVWVGNDDNSPMPVTGATGALPIWTQFMANSDNQSMPFIKPRNVEYHWVEPQVFALSAEGCDGAVFLPFVEGTEPQEKSLCARNKKRTIGDWMDGMFDWLKGR